MGIDLDMLDAPPWTIQGDVLVGPTGFPMLLAEDDTSHPMAALRFAALARNAFDGDPEALAWWEANRKRPVDAQKGKE